MVIFCPQGSGLPAGTIISRRKTACDAPSQAASKKAPFRGAFTRQYIAVRVNKIHRVKLSCQAKIERRQRAGGHAGAVCATPPGNGSSRSGVFWLPMRRIPMMSGYSGVRASFFALSGQATRKSLGEIQQ